MMLWPGRMRSMATSSMLGCMLKGPWKLLRKILEVATLLWPTKASAFSPLQSGSDWLQQLSESCVRGAEH